MKKKPTIAIAMSGGVDSSVSAYLLKKQGYNLVGVFMHLWHDPDFTESENKCCSLDSREDARRVAKKLGFKLYTLNFSSYFKKYIVNDFIKQYSQGFTPNPCVLCNKIIKFDFLLKKVKAIGADYLATGHYVKLKNNFLYKPKDNFKDQSYFLYQIKPANLKSLIFPLADYKKEEVYKIAKENDLLPKNKKESQDVCFLPKNDLASFLNKYIKKNILKAGDIIDINSNKKLGTHKGLAIYTYGQRGGIGVGGNGPYYVVKKDYKKNILYITNNYKDKKLYQKKLIAKNINWLIGQKPIFPLKCKAKSRYGQLAKDCTVNNNEIIFTKSQRALTPGQSIVFYKRNQLLGGGIINKILYDSKTNS